MAGECRPISAGSVVQRAGKWRIREEVETEEDRVERFDWRFCTLIIVNYIDFFYNQLTNGVCKRRLENAEGIMTRYANHVKEILVLSRNVRPFSYVYVIRFSASISWPRSG